MPAAVYIIAFAILAQRQQAYQTWYRLPKQKSTPKQESDVQYGIPTSALPPDVKGLPRYTQVLAMDTVGQTVLREIKKMSDFPVITKPSSFRDYDFDVISQKELSNKADSVYALTLDVPNSGRFALKFTPYVKS